MADMWHFYKNKVSFPYVRQIGAAGDTVKYKVGQEKQFCDFLRTKESAYLWSDSEDIQIMSNMYQMKIKIITTKGDNDKDPKVSWVGPDQELDEFKLLPQGIVPQMTLIHYDKVHYNLVI